MTEREGRWTRRDVLRATTLAAAGAVVGAGAEADAEVDSLRLAQAEPRATPVVVSTWPFGLPANRRAWERLLAGADALDAVVEGVSVCELDPDVSTVGLGGYPNSDGVVQLDACVMHGPTRRCGAVGALERLPTAAAVAHRVMTESPHLLLVGTGALAFARAQGFEERELLTDAMRARWEARRAPADDAGDGDGTPGESTPGHDTIGMLAIDQAGTISGACTTSGTPWKAPGRVGDSPIIGAGLFVDGEVGGATATGRGEEIIRVAGTHLIVELMRFGSAPQAACEEACDRIIRNHPGAADVPDCAFLALRADGEVGAASVNGGYFQYARSDAEGHRLLDAPGRR